METDDLITDETLAILYVNWCESFKTEKTQPMSKTISEEFFKLLHMEKSGSKLDPTEKDDVFMILKIRSNFIGLIINELVIKVISTISDSHPIKGMMYLYYLKYYQISNNNTPITVNLISKLFPFGFLTVQALNRLCDMQKIKPYNINLLDMIEDLVLSTIGDNYENR